MLFVYLLIFVLCTGGLSAENTTLSTDVCPKDSDACKGCTGSWVACPGKDGAPICSKKYNQVDPKGSVCQYKGCPVGEGQILLGMGLLCVPFKHFVNGTLPGSYLWEGCQQQMQINCGTWTPIASMTLSDELQRQPGWLYHGRLRAGHAQLQNGKRD
ncbi:unnamed protein product, partial [Mesorhabditis spiculigera]